MSVNHGTDSAYVRGCRCSECTEAHRIAARLRYERSRLGATVKCGKPRRGRYGNTHCSFEFLPGKACPWHGASE